MKPKSPIKWRGERIERGKGSKILFHTKVDPLVLDSRGRREERRDMGEAPERARGWERAKSNTAAAHTAALQLTLGTGPLGGPTERPRASNAK